MLADIAVIYETRFLALELPACCVQQLAIFTTMTHS